jgi:small subunit ribosomal protein S16
MLKIRLRRMGARHSPFYRVVVSDSRNVPTASAVEELGHYDPTTNPARVTLNADRVSYWLARGAKMSPTVERLVEQARQSA